MGFSDSFNEAFNKTAPIATAGAMDLIKDKIKEHQKKTDETHQAESIKSAILSTAAATGDENTIKQYGTIVDSLKGSESLAALKLVHADLQSRIKASQNQQNQQANTMLQKGYQPTDPNAPEDPEAINVGGRNFSPVSGLAADDAKTIAQGIMNGDQPPIMTGLYGKSAAVKAELERNKFDLSKATRDWASTLQFAKSLNGPQQLRLNQALTSVESSLPVLQDISKQFERTGWTPANKVELTAALTGTDPKKRDIATKYITQINVMKDELAQSFMSGGVPTDGAFKMADDILNPVYGVKQLSAGIEQLGQNLRIRRNAILNSSPNLVGGSGNSSQQSEIPSYDPKTQKLQSRTVNGKTEYRVVSK